MADGWLEQGYSLLDEISPNPGRYYPPEDEAVDAARFTGQTVKRWRPNESEFNMLVRFETACQCCDYRLSCQTRGSDFREGCEVAELILKEMKQ